MAFTPITFELTPQDAFGALKVAAGESIQEFKLVLDFEALASIHAQLGLDLADPRTWEKLRSFDIPIVCLAALKRYHPDITIEKVQAMVPTRAVFKLRNMLMELCFPGLMEEAAKAAENGKVQNPPPATS